MILLSLAVLREAGFSDCRVPGKIRDPVTGCGYEPCFFETTEKFFKTT